MYDVSSLIAFYFFAELGSITDAAKVFNISQVAMSKRIRKAESECGVALIDRSRSGNYRITKEGHIIKQGVEIMLTQYSNMLREIKGAPGIITVSCSTELFMCDLLFLISKFRLYHPDVFFRVLRTSEDDAIRMLREGAVTYALIPYDDRKDPYDRRICKYPLVVMTRKIGAVFPEWVPPTRKQYITSEMLIHYDAVIPSDDDLKTKLIGWFGKDNFPPSLIRLPSVGEVLMSVKEGMGYAALPMYDSIAGAHRMRIRPLYPAVHIKAAIVSGNETMRNRSVMLFDRFLSDQGTA